MARKNKKIRIPGVSFSAKRAFGVSKAKRKFAKATGIPTTKAGRQRKIGKMMTGGGCLLPVLGILMTATAIVTTLIMLLL